MKIRTQCILGMVLFGVMLTIVSASVIITSGQVERLNEQEKIAHRIERGASDLGYLSNDYLLYHESNFVHMRGEHYLGTFICPDLLGDDAPQFILADLDMVPEVLF